MKYALLVSQLFLLVMVSLSGCNDQPETSDKTASSQKEEAPKQVECEVKNDDAVKADHLDTQAFKEKDAEPCICNDDKEDTSHFSDDDVLLIVIILFMLWFIFD